jgi:YfiH family protein
MTPAWILPNWPVARRVRALSTQRVGGVSAGLYAALNLGDHVGDDPGSVAENRRRLRLAAGLPAEPAWLRQVHGSEVARWHAPPAADDAPPTADASVCDRPGIVLALLTADCLPVLFTTRAGDRIAAAHAGWRGLAAGVLGATLEALGVPPDQVIAWIGPGIGPCHYEVGGEVRDALSSAGALGAQDPAFVPARPGHYRADLPALARRQLSAAGVPAVYSAGICTCAHPEQYFSHRRDGRTGRQATLIWLDA